MRNKLLPVLLLCTLFLAGCFNAEEERLRVSENISPFYDSLLFEDIDKTMVFFTSNSETYYETYQNFIQSFNSYNLLYEPSDVTFTSVDKELIAVDVVVHITGINNQKEKVDRTVLHKLEFQMNSEGVWKISSLTESAI